MKEREEWVWRCDVEKWSSVEDLLLTSD